MSDDLESEKDRLVSFIRNTQNDPLAVLDLGVEMEDLWKIVDYVYKDGPGVWVRHEEG